MKWNNGLEQLKFEKEQEKLRKQYLEAGMTEEQIQAIYDYDKEYLNLRQREARHTQQLEVSAFEDADDYDSKNPLYKKFLENFSASDTHWKENSNDWVEQIENEKLYKAIKQLDEEDIDLLTMVYVNGYKQKEIANIFGVSSMAISKKLSRIKKYLKSF